MSAPLELEVLQLLIKAEPADATPLPDGLTIPGEITRRQERKTALAPARVEIVGHAAHARYTIPLAEQEQKLAVRTACVERGEKVRGDGRITAAIADLALAMLEIDGNGLDEMATKWISASWRRSS